MTYPLQQIAGHSVLFQNLTLGGVLHIAKINNHFFEKQLTYFLSAITNNAINAQRLTIQERYALFIKYLSIIKENNLSESIEKESYLNPDLNSFSTKRVEHDGVTVRHLTGTEVEAMEICCEDTVDWILAEMAITIGCTELPELDIPSGVEHTARQIQSRIEQLHNMDVEQFNILRQKYFEAQALLPRLIIHSFDNGIVLEKFHGGADDAPIRFRVNSAITGECSKLLQLSLGAN